MQDAQAPEGYEALKRVDTLAEQIYRQLARAVTSGSYAPKERVNIRRLSDEIGASVTPVREAVLRLVADGILDVTDKNAIVVPERTEKEIEEIFQIRRVLEGEMALAAAPNFDRSDISRLTDTQSRFLGALADEDYKAALQLNADFHFAIYARADLPLHLEITRMLWLKIGPTLRNMYPILQKNRSENRRHEAIIEALSAGDPQDLRLALLADLESSRNALLGYLRSEKDQPPPSVPRRGGRISLKDAK